MPRKQQEPWFQPADFLRIGIPVAALAAGFYFTTNARLSESDKSFELINKRFETVITSVEEVKKKTIETGNKDAEGRSKVRDEFIKAQNETNQSLARVDTKLAVAETKFEQMVNTLNKISDQLGNAVHNGGLQPARKN